MRKRPHAVETNGLPVLSLPVTRKNRVNEKQKAKMVTKSERRVTALQLLGMAGIYPDAPMLFCGSHSKALPMLQELVKMTDKPFLLLGSVRTLENSPLNWLDISWEAGEMTGELPCGNGKIAFENRESGEFALTEVLLKADGYLPVLCLGNGCCMDEELFEAISRFDSYILLSGPILAQSVKEIGGRMRVEELLSKMSYVIVSSIGAKSACELIRILPEYEEVKVSDGAILNLHRDTPGMDMGRMHHGTGIGFQLSQNRSKETRPVLTQDDFRSWQEDNRMFVYNALAGHIWIG